VDLSYRRRCAVRRLYVLVCTLALVHCDGAKPPPEEGDEAGPATGSEDDDAPEDDSDGSDVAGDDKGSGGGARRDSGTAPGKSDAGGAHRPASGDGGATAGDSAVVEGGAQPGQGCSAKLLPLPEDPKQRGPWDVGVRTVKIDRLTVEMVYPAKPGSTKGVPEVTYDIRKWLPPQEQEKVPADHSPAVQPLGGPIYRDVPIDDAHGPYPVVIFIHGTASFRIASMTTNAHWASRGFIVLAADYPGLGLADQVSATLECGLPTSGAQDLPGDVSKQLDALKSASGELAFLAGHADTTRVGISGHSQGGCVSATLSTLPNVRIVMPFSGSTPVTASDSLESILYVSGMNDTVIGYNFPLIGNVVCPIGSATTELAYEFSPGPTKVKRRLLGISGGGHLVVTDLCQKNMQGKNAIEEANENKVCGVTSAVIIGLPALFDCGTIDWKLGLEAVNYATSAALEETLHCQVRTQQFANLKSALPQVGDFREAQ